MTTGYATQLLSSEFAKQALGPLFSDSITGREGLLNSVAHLEFQLRNVGFINTFFDALGNAGCEYT